MLENSLCPVLFHLDSSSHITQVLLTLSEWPSLSLPSASSRQDMVSAVLISVCRRPLFSDSVVHRYTAVHQTFVTDTPVGGVSLSFHCGTQACHKWLLDAAALLCGLAPLFPMIRILSACVLCVLILVPVLWWLSVSERDHTQPSSQLGQKKVFPAPVN